jgi:long-chain acyl-CoA synthetase
MVRIVTTAARPSIRMTSADPPWVTLYGDGVPATVVPQAGDMLSIFKRTLAANPQGEALLYFGGATSFADLDCESDAVAIWLQQNGVGRGDRVQIVAQNIPAFPILCLAAWKLGAVPVPGNPMYRAAELAQIFADAQPSAILFQDCDAEEALEGLAKAGLSDIPMLVASPRDGLSSKFAQIVPAVNDNTPGTRLADVLARQDGTVPEIVELGAKDLGLILYTSGTTGRPKGAMLTHGNMAFNAETTMLWFSLDKTDRIMAIAPFFHITGLICHMAVAFRAGCTMVMTYRFEPAVVLGMIRDYRPTFTVAAITAFNALMNVERASKADFASLTKVWSGGAPIAHALLEQIRERTGLEIYNAYGMTELTSPVILAPRGVPMPVDNGVLPLGIPIPSTEIRIIDDDGSDVELGAAGEIIARGPQVMAGYWRNQQETEAALAGGWMHTGDVGYRDKAGWIYLIDRKKDVIIASGFKVWPREVEDVLHEHPAVREAAVVSMADAYRGETVKALISVASGQSVTPDAIIAHCRSRLAAYKVPRLVEIMDELPKTVTGKIQRAVLRENAKQEA